MANEFENYYEVVQEHANDILDNLYDELLNDLKEYSTYSFFSWYNNYESYIFEYNNGVYISLRDAVDILEQSNRLCTDEGLYIHAGDCREQVQAMAYYTYRNDLMCELREVLKARLEKDVPEFEKKVENLQEMIDAIEEEIDEKEEKISEFQDELEIAREEDKPRTVKEIEKLISSLEIELEKLNNQKEKMEEEIDEPTNLHYNAEKFLGEI